jgi:hypothetical protein
VGLNWVLKPLARVGSQWGLICRVRGSQVGIKALGAGNLATWLGSQKSGGVGARVGGLRSRLVTSVGKCRSRCVRCMCGRAACAVCRRPARRWGRRARAAHKYRSPAGGLFDTEGGTYTWARLLLRRAVLHTASRARRLTQRFSKVLKEAVAKTLA